MKKLLFVLIAVVLAVLVSVAASAADSPVQPVPEETYVAVLTPDPHPEVTPVPGVSSEEVNLTQQDAAPVVFLETTTSERLRPGIEIRLFDVEEEDETGELQAVVPYEEVIYLEYDEKDQLTEEEQEKFTEYSRTAGSAAAENNTNLVHYFWIDIPEKYEELLRTKESYTDEDGNPVDDGEYLELNIVKPGTNITCTVNSKDMDVIDNKDGTVTLKLTETGAVAVFAEEVYSTDLNLTAEKSIPDVIPDPYIELLIDDLPALAICDNLNDEQQTAVATEDVILYPVEYISLLETEDQAIFLQAFEDVRDAETDQTLRYFFWIDLPYHYDLMLSDDPEEGEYLRLIFNIPGENPVVTVNGKKMDLELIEGTTYAVKLTCTGAVVVYSDPTEEELAAAAVGSAADITASGDLNAVAASSDDESWHRG